MHATCTNGGRRPKKSLLYQLHDPYLIHVFLTSVAADIEYRSTDTSQFVDKLPRIPPAPILAKKIYTQMGRPVTAFDITG